MVSIHTIYAYCTFAHIVKCVVFGLTDILFPLDMPIRDTDDAASFSSENKREKKKKMFEFEFYGWTVECGLVHECMSFD